MSQSASQQLAKAIEKKRLAQPSLSTEEAYAIVKREDPELIKQFGQEIGFVPVPATKPNWVSAQ